MKGILPFFGKFMFPLPVLLSTFLFLFSISGVQAKTIVIGSGFGSVSVNNMNGLNPGDVLAITPGNYSGGGFSNLKGITITNNGGTVTFQGQVTLTSLVECVFSGFNFENIAQTAIRWEGNSRRCTEKNISFKNVLGNANDASDKNQYNGDTSSLKMYICTFDNLTLSGSGMVFQGSWGSTSDNVCYIDSIVFSNIKVDQTTTNGTEVRGIFFRMNAHDWKITYTGTNNLDGDVGIFYIIGNGYFHNNYRSGGRGYLMRIWNTGLKSTGNTYFYNNIDLNSSQYGSIDSRIDNTQFNQYTTGGNCYIFNNTSGNKEDHIGYWSSIAVIGTYPKPWILQTRNNLGFNLNTNGKPPITMNQSDGSWITDSSNDLYFNKPDGVVDPTTGIPVANSPVLGKGVTIPWIKDDYYYNPRVGAFDIGAVQHSGTPIPSVNKPPVAVADKQQIITLPVDHAKLDGTKSSDPDDGIASYLWELSSGTGGTITSPNASTTTVTGLTQGTYIYKLTVTDKSKATASTFDTVIVKAAVNKPPVANAGNSKSITLPTDSVSLDGSLSADPDGSIASYSWTQIAGPSASVINGASKVVASAGKLVPGQYTFELTVTDNKGATAKTQIKISVIASGKQSPVANAGANQTITLPVNSVTINGSGSTASSGSIVSYVWREGSGPSTVTLVNTAQNKLDNLHAGKYIFYLTVTDNDGATGSDSVIITVNAAANKAPTANAGPDINLTLPANSVTLDGSNSTDPDGRISKYSWTRLSGPNDPTEAGAATASLTLSGLIAGQYIYQLSVTDNSGASSLAQVKITVAEAPNVLPIAKAGADLTITEPTNSVNLNGSASSDPDGKISTYSWVKISGPGSVTISNSNTATPSVVGLQTGTYVFELTVTDNRGGVAKDQMKVTVNPKPAQPNQTPIANAGNNLTITSPANSIALNGNSSFDPDGTLSGFSWKQVSGPSTSTISGGSTATPTVSQLVVGQYVFELTVTDNKGATNKDQVTVTVNQAVAKANQSPVADAGLNATIDLPVNTYVLDASGSTDPDGTVVSYQWQELSGPNSVTSSSMNSSKVTISGLQMGEYEFQVDVKDNQGAGSTATVKLTVEQGSAIADQLLVYPNPAHDVINGRISSTVTGTTKINVYDMNGRMVITDQAEKTGDILEKTFAVDRLASGMYTIQINIANKKTMVTKFIKN